MLNRRAAQFAIERSGRERQACLVARFMAVFLFENRFSLFFCLMQVFGTATACNFKSAQFATIIADQHALGRPAARLMSVLIFQQICLLYTSPSPRDRTRSRMPSSA